MLLALKSKNGAACVAAPFCVLPADAFGTAPEIRIAAPNICGILRQNLLYFSAAGDSNDCSAPPLSSVMAEADAGTAPTYCAIAA